MTEPFYTQEPNPTEPRLVVQVRSIPANINIINTYKRFNNILEPDLWKYVKYRRYPWSPECDKLSSIMFNSPGDITVDIVFQQVIYRLQYRQKIMCKFVFKIIIPVIPVIPVILYILLVLLHPLCHNAIRQYKTIWDMSRIGLKKFIIISSTYMRGLFQIFWTQLLYNGNRWKQMIAEVTKR